VFALPTPAPITRTTDLPLSAGAIYQFDINIAEVTSTATSAHTRFAGTSFNHRRIYLAANADVHSRFGINSWTRLQTRFSFRDLTRVQTPCSLRVFFQSFGS
jgi:hypothetical protein